jgi:hypothetical protein
MMYKKNMKTTAQKLEEAASTYKVEPVTTSEMVRTQVYLTESEHAFVQREGRRLGKPMAAVLRDWIDEKMSLPEDAWANSSLLEPPAEDFDGPEDAAINHDHYLYGGPKKYKKVKGKWVHLPMLP